MKIAPYFFIFFISIFINHQVEAGQIHAVLIGDTIGGEWEFQSCIDYMVRETKRISALTDLEADIQVFEGVDVQLNNILYHFSKLEVTQDDIILLYVAAHGSRKLEKANKWPDLILDIDIALRGEEGFVDFKDLFETLKSKNPRLLIAIADSCNGYRNSSSEGWQDDSNDDDDDDDDDDDQDLEGFYKYSLKCQHITCSERERLLIQNSTEEETEEKYRNLFLESKGNIIVSSSSPGEKASKIYYPIGGLYTVAFIKALNRLDTTCNSNSLWKQLLDFAEELSTNLRETHNVWEYRSQYEIDLLDK